MLVLLHVYRGLEYWNFSEGVYALSARILARGGDLYGHVVAAQPPGLYLAGAGILAVHDGLEWLRWVLGALQLVAGVLAARIAWRLTASRIATIVTPALVLLTPWAVHEHGTLTPELFAPPLVLGGALLASRRRTAAWGGAVAAVAVAFKLPFVIPVALVVLAGADRRRAGLAALGVLVTAGLVALGVFGSGLWRDTVTAQLDTGRRSLHDLGGFWAQGGWNLLGLVVLALVAVAGRRALRDPALQRTAGAAALGFLLTFLTNYKEGTGLNITVPVEAALVPLALAGVVVLGRSRGGAGTSVGVLFVALTLAGSASLLLSPRTAWPFLYPSSQRNSWGRTLSAPEVEGLVRQARACPPGVPYPGAPFIAFLAHRPVPDDQPDTFLATRSPLLAPVARAIAADGPRCP